jgi:hypothetical protein
VVYRAPAGVSGAELFDGTTTRFAIQVDPATDSTLAAPEVAEIAHAAVKEGSHWIGTTVATLSADPPSDAVAMVIYDAKSKRALSYGEISPGEREVYVWGRGVCDVDTKGTVRPKVKQKVTVRFVDGFGRLSPASKQLVIQPATDSEP